MKSDELSRLLCRAQDGDAAAYETFLKEVTAELRPFLRKRVQANDQVEDVMQEILISIHRGRHTYRPEKPLAPWLYGIAQNRITDFYRRYRLLEKREVALAPEFDAPDERALIDVAGGKSERVVAALTTVPRPQRRVIELLKLESLSVKETALKLGMTEGAVKVAASRGYKAIRKALGVKSED